MRVVIVDDERLARERLARLLAIHPDVQIIGEAADGLADGGVDFGDHVVHRR